MSKTAGAHIGTIVLISRVKMFTKNSKLSLLHDHIQISDLCVNNGYPNYMASIPSSEGQILMTWTCTIISAKPINVSYSLSVMKFQMCQCQTLLQEPVNP